MSAFRGHSNVITGAAVGYPFRNLQWGVYRSPNASDRGGTAMLIHYQMYNCAKISFLFSNTLWNGTMGVGETVSGLSTLTVCCSYSANPDGPWIPLTVGGSKKWLHEPGVDIATDAVVAPVAKGERFFTRTDVQVPVGGCFPTGIQSQPPGSGVVDVSAIGFDLKTICGNNYRQGAGDGPGKADGSNQTLTGGNSWQGSYAGYCYGPIGVFDATGELDVPVIGLGYGDSIGSGLVDQHDLGYLTRALLNGGLTGWMLSYSGETFRNALIPARRADRERLLEATTHCIVQLGINTVNSGASLAEVQANSLELGAVCRAAGSIPFQTTLTPVVTGGLATAAGQVPFKFEATRVAFNTWVRARMPVDGDNNPVAVGTPGAIFAGPGTAHIFGGVFDPARLIEANAQNVIALNGGRWWCGSANDQQLTHEGVHPLQYGHLLMAPAIVASDFAFK